MYFSNRQKAVLLSLFTLGAIFIRFDFVYSGKQVYANKNDTLWEYLTDNVFHDPQLTALSIQYINKTILHDQTNYIQANINSKGGDRI